MTAKPIPLSMRRQVWARSEFQCEACGLDRASHVHHRKLRSQGGEHTLDNLLHVSHECHERIHANRDGKSYDRGLLVSAYAEPDLVPVVMFESEPSDVG